MIFAILGLTIYNIILTLFVIKINNRPEKIQCDDFDTLQDQITTLAEYLENLKEQVDKIYKPLVENNLPQVVEEHTNGETNLNQVASELDKMLSGKTREQMEEWINEIPNEPTKLNTLNKKYGKQY